MRQEEDLLFDAVCEFIRENTNEIHREEVDYYLLPNQEELWENHWGGEIVINEEYELCEVYYSVVLFSGHLRIEEVK